MMDLAIRLLRDDDIAAVVELSLLAWAPVFESIRQILGPSLYAIQYPDDWKAIQSTGVEGVCKNKAKYTTLVADAGGVVAGFIAYELRAEEQTGEVTLLAVRPEFQNQGIGTELNNAALAEMKARGMRMAMVETGGDSSHAPARRSYEKAGYTLMPIARYFQAL
jgi:ribosomal protein S18 acetylase RimI-like enzyme